MKNLHRFYLCLFISIGDPITRRKVGIPSNLFVLIPSLDFINICRGFFYSMIKIEIKFFKLKFIEIDEIADHYILTILFIMEMQL